MQETFATFLQELDSSNLAECSGKELLEREVLRIMRGEGFSDDQIYSMPLAKLLDLFYDTYLWSTNEILSKSIVMDSNSQQKHLG